MSNKTSILVLLLTSKCPNCLQDKVFNSWLKLKPQCKNCKYKFNQDSGDGPAVFAMFIVGALGFGLALYLSFALFWQPLWVFFVSFVATLLLAVLCLRPMKYMILYYNYCIDLKSRK